MKITYWTFTVMATLPLILSGIGFSLALPPAVQGMAHLGYPVYLVKFLGIAKVLGALAILAGTFPKLKEWAYAGATFNLMGACYSHLCSHDGAKSIGPLVVLAFTLVSYSYWKKLAAVRAAEARQPLSTNAMGSEFNPKAVILAGPGS